MFPEFKLKSRISLMLYDFHRQQKKKKDLMKCLYQLLALNFANRNIAFLSHYHYLYCHSFQIFFRLLLAADINICSEKKCRILLITFLNALDLTKEFNQGKLKNKEHSVQYFSLKYRVRIVVLCP